MDFNVLGTGFRIERKKERDRGESKSRSCK